MTRFDDCGALFEHAILRSSEMVKLFDALALLRPSALNDDALRAAYFQAVSSFDFYVHELVAIEARYRFVAGLKTKKLVLPMDLMAISNEGDRISGVDAYIRNMHSYKAFVDPAKLAEVLSCFCDEPWSRIADAHASKFSSVKADDLKAQLRIIWKRRNKIAHEADIDPTLSSTGLWPIDKHDTESTIDFLKRIGACLPHVLETAPLL